MAAKTHKIVLLVIMLIGIILRLREINYSLNVDEVFSIRASSGSLSNLVRATISDRVHPPLYYLFLHFWMKFAGSSETALRLLSVLASILFLLLLSKVVFELTEGFAGWFAVSFCAVGGYFVYYGQEARPYTFAALFCTLSVWCILKIQDDPGNVKYKIYYALACCALLYIQYIGLLFLLPQFAAVALGRFREKRGILFSGFLGTLSLAPWLLVVGKELSPRAITPNLAWIAKPTWHDLSYLYVQIFGWLPLSGTTRILFLVTGVVLLSLLLQSKNLDWGKIILIAGSALFPPVAAFLISRYGPVSIWALRQLIGSVVMIVCLLAVGLAAHRRALGLGLGAFLLAWCLFTLPGWFPEEMSPPWSPVAKALAETCADCEIEVPDLSTQVALGYYSRQHIHSTARRLSPAEGLRSLPYWLPNSPDRERETDRILFLCRPGRCAALDFFRPDYQLGARSRFTWGRSRGNPAKEFDIYMLKRCTDGTPCN